MLSALYAIANPSVRPSHGWISRKRLKLGSCNFHHTVAPSLYFFHGKFHLEILTDPPERGRQTRVGNLTVVACMKLNTWRLHSLDGAVILRHCVCTYFSTNSAELTWSAKLETATLFCNKWCTCRNLFCACVFFGFCFKLDYFAITWRPI